MNVRKSVINLFQSRFGKEPERIVRAPGRVNLLGEHVDYNNGFVLPIAIDRATWLAFSANSSNCHRLIAMDLEQEICFSNPSILFAEDCFGRPLPAWARYPAGVAWAAGEAGLDCPGMDAVYGSEVPQGSGLSSSASVEMAFVLAWQSLAGWDLSPMERALLGQKAENQYVGVQSGIMDQFASACGEADSILVLDCRDLTWRTIPIPSDYAFIVANTMKPRRLDAGDYNARRADCESALRLLERQLPGIKSLRDISLAKFNQLAPLLPERIEKRARHVVEEIQRTIQAIPLLQSGDLTRFGELVEQSHVSLRDLFEVSTPELNLMVSLAQQLPSCLGARLTGAGFGGCTINIVKAAQARPFVGSLAKNYHSATGIEPEIYVCRPAPGAGLAR